jgi:hypothetical protein
MDEKLLPVGEPEPQVIITEKPAVSLPGVPSQEQQQWGVVISIVVIVLMIVIGAFYAWGKRIAQEQELIAPSAAQ